MIYTGKCVLMYVYSLMASGYTLKWHTRIFLQDDVFNCFVVIRVPHSVVSGRACNQFDMFFTCCCRGTPFSVWWAVGITSILFFPEVSVWVIVFSDCRWSMVIVCITSILFVHHSSLFVTTGLILLCTTVLESYIYHLFYSLTWKGKLCILYFCGSVEQIYMPY